MFTRLRSLAILAALAFVPTAFAEEAANGMKKGNVELQSAGALAFGPDGVLFVADAKTATIYAIATGDTKPAGVKKLSIPKLDELVGGLLGTTGSEIRINDMKVNSGQRQCVPIRFARQEPWSGGRHRQRSAPKAKASEVPLKDVMYSSVKLENASKNSAITSMAYNKGDLYVAGLTNEEWAANLRAIPFPFTDKVTNGAGVQIYHGAHGSYETQGPDPDVHGLRHRRSD